MPNIIEWANWQAVQNNINAANKAVSGMSPAEAQAALGFNQTGLQNGTNLQVVNSQNIPSNSGQVIQFPNSSASQAAADYVSSGGQVTPGGAASVGGNTSQVNNMTMTQTGAGITSIGALLSVNLPTAAAAIAPVAGFALGAGLYSLSPDLWEKISRALLPFCYDGTELLPVVADENGSTYFQKEAIEAVKKEIENSVQREVNQASAFPILANRVEPFPFSVNISAQHSYVRNSGEVSTLYTSTPTAAFHNGLQVPTNYPDIYVASAVPFKWNYNYPDELKFNASKSYTHDGKTVYYELTRLSASGDAAVDFGNITLIAFNGADPDYIMWTAIYGASETLPSGVNKWNGVQYPLNPEGIGVVTAITSDGIARTNPYYPVTMPVGDPGVSPNPDEVPRPGTNIEVAPAIDPWIKPSPDKSTYPDGEPESDPAKVPDPIPDTDPNLDPNANPSQQPEPQPEPNPDSVQSTKPSDDGTSTLPAIPVIPSLPSAASGLLHVYNPTQSQLDSFGSWLWTTFSGDLIDTISKLFNDPMDAVIGLHELYATPAVSGSSTIRAGFLDSGISSNLVGSRYTTINCGSIVVQEYYQNYLDYSPYTKCYIYLPFVGIVPVLADDIIGNAVNVTYHVDSYTGCCIAVVTVAREGYSSTVYQFEGNCAVEIPITSGYQSTLMGALIGAGATALTGNPHAGIAAANMGRASLGKNDVSHSGSFGSSYGAMGAKVPYIIVKRPTQKSVVNYNQDYGFPAHKRVIIGACSGYLRAREVHVISPTATDDEKARIEELLKQGVFVK